MRWVDFNGTILPENEAIIPVESRAVAYGEGFFETLISYSGKFLRLNDHYNRLDKGASLLQLHLDINEVSLRSRIVALLEQNNLLSTTARIRIQIGTTGIAGSGFDQKQRAFTLISANETDISHVKPVKLVSSDLAKIPSACLPQGVKWNQYLANMMALSQAKSSGADDALMLTTNGRVSETALANIFWMKGDVCFTPSTDCDILPGITRAIVLDALKQEEIPIDESHFRMESVLKADSVFLTNSGREIIPVSSLNNTEFDTNHPGLKRIQKRFQMIKEAELC